MSPTTCLLKDHDAKLPFFVKPPFFIKPPFKIAI